MLNGHLQVKKQMVQIHANAAGILLLYTQQKVVQDCYANTISVPGRWEHLSIKSTKCRGSHKELHQYLGITSQNPPYVMLAWKWCEEGYRDEWETRVKYTYVTSALGEIKGIMVYPQEYVSICFLNIQLEPRASEKNKERLC